VLAVERAAERAPAPAVPSSAADAFELVGEDLIWRQAVAVPVLAPPAIASSAGERLRVAEPCCWPPASSVVVLLREAFAAVAAG
jgi:hypothetical protein